MTHRDAFTESVGERLRQSAASGRSGPFRGSFDPEATQGAVEEPSARQASHDEIAELAYCIYAESGFPEGRALDHWLQAETEINRRNATFA